MDKRFITIPKEDLPHIALDMRHDILKMIHSCGRQNGHLGGCMSAVEILAVLYTQVMNINEVAHSDRCWSERDRFIMSKGHAGIAMYAALKQVGLISQDMINGPIRGDETVLYRHPKRNIKYGIECSVGSLGMGLGYGIGLAESFIRQKSKQRVYVMIGDGECDEGSVWESAAYAGHRKLENLIVIIDKNALQLDGFTHDVLSMDNMTDRWNAFGFKAVEVNGHDLNDIYAAFNTEHSGKPLAIIANTVKGKGVSFAENRVEWHDNYLSDELFEQGRHELGEQGLTDVRTKAQERFNTRLINDVEKTLEANVKLDDSVEQIRKWNHLGSKNVIGEVAFQLAEQDERFTLVFSDCANRIGIKKLLENHPEKCYEVGISEQNQIAMAAAMAHEGYHVVAIAYAPFITARVLDQIRTNLAYMQAPVCLIGLSAGMASSDLGATHTAFEDIANMRCLPNIFVSAPVDTFEIAKNMEYFCNNGEPMYIRITVNNSDSLIYGENVEFDAKKADVIDANGKIVLVCCGSILKEVMEAKALLKCKGIDAAVINVRAVKPLDDAMLSSLKNYELIVSIEEHNVIGGLGSALAEIIAEDKNYPMLKRIGIKDCYFVADTAANIREKIGLTGEQIAKKVLDMCVR